MTKRWQLLSPVVLVVAAGCGAAVAPAGTAPVGGGTEPAPLAPDVGILDLVPPAADGGLLLDVAGLRAATHGVALTGLVRRLGSYDWERAVGVDLRTDVERVVLFGVADAARGAGDLSAVLETLRAAALGAVIELRPAAAPGDGACRADGLAAATGTLLAAPAAGLEALRCGRFVVVRRLDHAGPLGPHPDAPLAAALREFLDDTGALREGLVFVATAGPAMVDRATCDAGTVRLAGWQRATIALGGGMRLGGVYTAAPGADVDLLRRCVGDGMGGFASVPLFAQLELDDVLATAVIEPVPGRAEAVSLEVGFDEDEMDLLMGLLELVGTGLREPP
jgi:hypothetical protein